MALRGFSRRAIFAEGEFCSICLYLPFFGGIRRRKNHIFLSGVILCDLHKKRNIW